MKNYLKDKRVLVGLLLVGAVAYYLYDQKRKAQIKADAEVLASTPATTEPEAVTPKPTMITEKEFKDAQNVKFAKLNRLGNTTQKDM